MLFPTNRGTALSHDALAQRDWPSTSPRCPSPGRTERSPRTSFGHAAAMKLLHAGVDIAVIALWLGHESVATTQIYLRADMALKQRALDRTAPTGTRAGRYKATDRLIDFLDGL